MLVITGTGRCGTSLVARFCKTMGYDPGGRWRNDLNAGMEHPSMIQWGHEIHRAVETGTVADWLALRGEDLKSFRPPVVKDPRFVSLPHTLPTWLSLRSDLRFLFLYRDEAAAVASARQYLKGPSRGLPLAEHVAHARETVKRFLDRVSAAKVPLRVLHFPHVLDDYESLHDSLTTFGGLAIERVAGREAWAGMVRRDLVHF